MILLRFKQGLLSFQMLMFALGVVFFPFPVEAQTLSEQLVPLLSKHERIVAAKEDLISAERGVMEAWGDWLPTADITFNLGSESQKKPDSDDTKKGTRNFEIAAKQLLYDFGKTGATIDSAKLSYAQSKLSYETARQGLILEATSAYINLLTSVQGLRFAQKSESNTKKQTGMEQSRVSRGSGFSSDVLQAKAQLAGAQANTVGKQGALVNAVDRYRTVFRVSKVDIKNLKKVRVPYDSLPKDLNSAVKIAKKNSISLQLSDISVKLAEQGIRTKKAAFAPKLEAKYDYKSKRNDAGVMGFKDTMVGKIELTYPLFAGGKDYLGYKKSYNALSAAQKRHADAEYGVTEQVRNAWQNLATSRLTAGFLRNQANISGEFLDLARKERKLGTRTLLDVLAGETSFITSISAAIQAEGGRDLAAYNLLFAMGLLTLNKVESNPKAGKAEGTPSATKETKAKPSAKSSKGPGKGVTQGFAP